MVEHLVCNQAVVGSNPVASTTFLPEANQKPTPMLAIRREQRGASRAFFENKVNGHDRGSHKRTSG